VLLPCFDCTSNRGFWLGGGHSKHALAILAFHQFSAQFIGYGKILAAFEVGTKQLNGHLRSPVTFIIVPSWVALESKGFWRFLGTWTRPASGPAKLQDWATASRISSKVAPGMMVALTMTPGLTGPLMRS